jgi:signal transduction histidine kinase
VLDVNESFARMINRQRPAVVGNKWGGLGLVLTSDEPGRLVELFRENGTVADYELGATTPEGRMVTVLLSLVSVTVNGEPCALAIAHDISIRKRSEEALRQAQEELALRSREQTALEERQRLARELHDSVSQALYGISLGANSVARLFDTNRTAALDTLKYVLGLTHLAMAEMRAVIFELRTESLELEGLVAALRTQLAALQARCGIEVELALGDEPAAPLPVKEALYRITLEAAQNAVKHARASKLGVSLSSDSDLLSVEVSDNGVGFTQLPAYPGHLGLRSMRERATILGGTFELDSEPGRGTRVRASIPLPAAP